MRRLLSLARMFVRIGAMNEMAYRANFWLQLFESILGAATALATVAVVFSQTDTLGGWSRSELTSLLGIYFVVLGSINLVVAPSLNRFMEQVVDGTLDFTLTKPADSQVLVSIHEFRLWKTLDICLGLTVLAIGLVGRVDAVGWVDAVSLVIALAAGGAIIYSFWMVLATLAFWFIRIENITQIFWAMYIAGRWPIGIYPAWLKWILTLLVPVAFAVTVPAEAISGRLEYANLLGAVVLAAVFLFLSRRFWLFGVRFYSGASA